MEQLSPMQAEEKTINPEKIKSDKSAICSTFKGQSSLKGFVSRPISLPRQTKINGLILNMVISDLQPFSIVEDGGFRELLKELEPSYVIPSRPTFSKSLMPAKYEEKVQKLKELINTAEHITLTTDGWTSINTEGYVAVTAHFITNDWQFYCCLLSCFGYGGRHTADNLAQELRRVTQEWSISDKVYAIATDNAANIVAATKATGWVHIPCFAHTVNLIVSDGLVHIGELKLKVKKIVEHFHRSSQAAAKFNSTQTQMHPHVTPLKLINDVPTRWNSTYYMLERIIALSEPLAATVGLLHNPVSLPTEEEWIILKELCQILKPFEAVTVEMSSEKQITLSKVILIVKGLISSLERIGLYITTQIANELINSLSSSIRSRFGTPETNIIMGKASFLDPRFKTKAFTNQDCLKKVKDRIQDEIVAIIKNNLREDTTEENGTKPAIEVLGKEETNDDIIWQDFDKSVKSSRNVASPLAVAIAEIRMFSEDANLDRKKNPLVWWEERQKVYPWLSKLAKKYLCIVATSVPCERVFSKAGQLISERRNRLKSKNVEQILFLHCNKNL